MPPTDAQVLQRQAQYCILAACVIAGGLGLAALIGWQFHVPALRSPGPTHIAMNPLTAISFVFLAIALACSRFAGAHPTWRRIGIGLALVVAGAGAVRLGALAGFDIGLDRVLYPAQLAREPIPNQMAPNTALSFLIVGLGMAGLSRSGWRDHPAAQVPFMVVLGLALLALVGHLYHLLPLYGVGQHIPMALNTALGFLVVAMAALLLRSSSGLSHLLLTPSSGGLIARWILPLAVLVPLATGALSLEAHRNGVYDQGWTIGLSTLANIAALIAVTWLTAEAVDRADRRRQFAEEEQQRALEQARFLNESVKVQKMQLEFMNQELEAFSYSVSHDLRAPLRHISGFVDLLLRFNAPQLDEKGRRRLGSVTGAVTQMGQLIDDLLEFSRMARSELHHATVDMTRLVGMVRAELEPEAQGRTVRWTVPALPPARGDEAMLRLVFTNLLSNALKYAGTRDEPVIEVGAWDGEIGGETTYFVRDNGVGFEMAYAHKLFGVFQRLHPQTEFPGTGIGLANVRRIVARHGGRTWAEGVLNAGATFYFTLPVTPDEAEEERWRA